MKTNNELNSLWNDNQIVLWNPEQLTYKSLEKLSVSAGNVQISNINLIGVNSSKFNPNQQQWTGNTNSISNSNPVLTSNLLLVGDNYWSLSYLQQSHLDRFKLIYLDPPYNTRTGEKSYHDSFEHSTWLTLLKNRLELMLPLLRDDGVLFLHLNKVELGYAQVLCDHIFGRKNFITIITWERSQRTLLGQGQTAINDTSEYILVYAKNSKICTLNRMSRIIPIQKKTYRQYNKIISFGKNEELVIVLDEESHRPIHIYKHPDAKFRTISLADWDSRQVEIDQIYEKNHEKIVRLSNQQSESTLQQRIIQQFPERNKIYSVRYIPDRGKSTGTEITKWYYDKDVILFLKDYTIRKDKQLFKVVDMNNFWTREDFPVTGIAGEGRVKLKRGKKPESLLRRIISIATHPGDWVLDAFGGSGTTGAVAHKMGRKWVLMELEQSSEMTIQRLTNVIQGKDQDKHVYKGGFIVSTISNELQSTKN